MANNLVTINTLFLNPVLLFCPLPSALYLDQYDCTVMELAKEVCQDAAGEAATSALINYLQQQRVTKREDLQFLQLDWLINALEPAGVPPMLLNKFLSLAKHSK